MLRVLALLLTAPLFADPAILFLRDGTKLELTRPPGLELTRTPVRAHIVEFREPPLAARVTRASTSSYHDTFARFRRDLGERDSGGPAASAAPRITHELYRAFHGVRVTLDERELAYVRGLAYVKAIHEDHPVRAFAKDNAANLVRIGADRIWSEWKNRGAGIVVAVIDTGIDASHPSLAGKVIGGWDFVDIDEDPSDENGHGTHVAGIIAGEGAGVHGVAPDAKLLSYRVLDEDGRGTAFAVLEALDWAVDPDRDNDLSDHADVVNLSLGGDGDADSPQSIAVDHAVEAGIVVCLAAGNDPGGQTIGSPAASRLGITVGAADANDVVAFWSSRGPSHPNLGLKPEIVAPGVSIVSAKSGGGTITYSGTSMAAPHVAGAAALLLALHPDWSPADVKAALIGSTDPVADEVMTRGSGRVNVFAAAGSTIAIDPPAVTFGNGIASGWSRVVPVRVTNHGSQPATFTATSSATNDGVTLVIDPATFPLDPGASREVTLTATVAANADVSVLTSSLGGVITFRNGEATAHLPWVAIHATDVHFDWNTPESPAAVVWGCENGAVVFRPRRNEQRFSALLPYRRCGVSLATSTPTGEYQLLFEKHQVTDGLRLERSVADIPYALQLAGVNTDGARLEPSPQTRYYATYALTHSRDSLNVLGAVITFSPGPLHVNSLDGLTVTGSQALFDFPRHRIYSVHHPPVGNFDSDVTLTNLPSDLQHVRVSIAPRGDDALLSGAVRGRTGETLFGSPASTPIPMRQGWRGDVYTTAEPNANAWAAPALLINDDLLTPPIRWVDGRFTLSMDAVPSPAALSLPPGQTIHIGEGPLHARSVVDTRDTAFAVFPTFYGPAGEYDGRPLRELTYEVRDASGTMLREGTTDSGFVSADPETRGRFHATIRSTHGVELALSFDTSADDWNPPTLLSLRIVDASGAPVEGVAPGENAALEFSAGDVWLTTEDVRTVKAWWRGPSTEWHLLQTAKNGLHHRAGLSTEVPGAIDVKIEMEDASGNGATVTIDGAFSVGARRRVVRR